LLPEGEAGVPWLADYDLLASDTFGLIGALGRGARDRHAPLPCDAA
jgi:hypothetical protein